MGYVEPLTTRHATTICRPALTRIRHSHDRLLVASDAFPTVKAADVVENFA